MPHHLAHLPSISKVTKFFNSAVDKLKEVEGFHMVNIDDEEDEHSIEMHLPYIAKTLGKEVKIVPIMTGPVNEEMADKYGKIFAPYFDDP